jgi:ribosomal protein S8
VIQILQNEGFISHYSLVTVEKEKRIFNKQILKKSSKTMVSKEIKVYFKK